jgi:hypothetical protein
VIVQNSAKKMCILSLFLPSLVPPSSGWEQVKCAPSFSGWFPHEACRRRTFPADSVRLYPSHPPIIGLSAVTGEAGISESRFGKVMVPRMGDGETVGAGWGSVLCVHREIHEGERSDVGEFKPHSAC